MRPGGSGRTSSPVPILYLAQVQAESVLRSAAKTIRQAEVCGSLERLAGDRPATGPPAAGWRNGIPDMNESRSVTLAATGAGFRIIAPVPSKASGPSLRSIGSIRR